MFASCFFICGPPPALQLSPVDPTKNSLLRGAPFGARSGCMIGCGSYLLATYSLREAAFGLTRGSAPRPFGAAIASRFRPILHPALRACCRIVMASKPFCRAAFLQMHRGRLSAPALGA